MLEKNDIKTLKNNSIQYLASLLTKITNEKGRNQTSQLTPVTIFHSFVLQILCRHFRSQYSASNYTVLNYIVL